MTKDIIAKLKEASESLDSRIQAASNAMRTADMSRFQNARTHVQGAITELLEIRQ